MPSAAQPWQGTGAMAKEKTTEATARAALDWLGGGPRRQPLRERVSNAGARTEGRADEQLGVRLLGLRVFFHFR